MRPVRIAFLDQTAQLGGAEVALINTLGVLDRTRWEPVVLLGSDGPLKSWLVKNGISVEVLLLPAILARVRQEGLGRSLINPIRLVAALTYLIRLARWLRRRRVEIVHLNSLKLGLLGGLAGRLSGIPSVWQVHSIVAEPMIPRRVAQVLRLLGRCLSSAIVTNSLATGAAFSPGNDKVAVIPCGVDSRLFYPNRRFGTHSVVGMVARFAPIKGQHVFLAAIDKIAAEHPSTRFVLAGTALFGEDAYEAEIRRHAIEGKYADRISFPGFVTDVPALLQTLDIVVQPSTQPEGFGLIVAEAMMSGKPVIVSAAGGSQELIVDGVTGRVVPADDSAALASAIDDLLSYPSSAAEMGERARKAAIERYDIRNTTSALEAVYEGVLG